MFKQWIRSRTLSLVAAAITSAWMLAAPAHAQDIKVGFNADQSGTAVAELGIAARHGFDLAIGSLLPAAATGAGEAAATATVPVSATTAGGFGTTAA